MDMDNGIFLILTQNPDKWMTVVSLYNQYTKEYPRTNKKDFILSCELLNTRFKNIRKCHKNNLCCLAFITDNNLIPESFHNEEKYYEMTTDESFKLLDKCVVIEYMINNPQYNPSISFSEYFDGNDTILHILFKEGRVDLIKKIERDYDINLDITNSKNESLLDVINYNKNNNNSNDLVKLYIDHKFKRLNRNYDTHIEQIKQTNMILLETNKDLVKENDILKKDKKNVTFYKYVTNFFIVISFAILYFRLKLY